MSAIAAAVYPLNSIVALESLISQKEVNLYSNRLRLKAGRILMTVTVIMTLKKDFLK